jgi:hypothetical protein
VQRLAALAWVEHAEGNQQSALRSMQAAADLGDKTEKHPVTPGPVLPARELLGELLMELDQPARALPEFEKVLQASPNRVPDSRRVLAECPAVLDPAKKSQRLPARARLLELGSLGEY